MSLLLSYLPGACSFVPHVVLEHLALSGKTTYQTQVIDAKAGQLQSEAFLKLNPNGQVPVLQDGDNVITQIPAILVYLDQKFPNCDVLPLDALARARALEAVCWLGSSVHATFGHIYKADRFAQEASSIDDVRRTNIARYKVQLGQLTDKIAAFKANGQTFFHGAKPGAADAYSVCIIRWGKLAGIDMAQDFSSLWSFAHEVAKDAVVASTISQEGWSL